MSSQKTEDRSLLARLQARLPAPLEPGALMVVMAGPGVGKTSFLVQAGLDETQAGRQVLHVAMGAALEQVQAYYDALLADRHDLAGGSAAEHTALRVELARRRAVQVLPRGGLKPAQLEEALETYAQHLGLQPSVALVDGDDWAGEPGSLGARLLALKETARARAALVVACVNLPAESEPAGVPAPIADVLPQVDLGVLLQPEGDRVSARVVVAAGRLCPAWDAVALEPDTLLPRDGQRPGGGAGLQPAACVLLSGAAEGSEAEFGALAERWGVVERHVSFTGRKTARSRGLVLLSPQELKQGDVSWTYLKAHMHRDYKRTAEFRKVMQSIWHQVNPTGEVFGVGVIQADDTVRGGTGWAVQLAKHLHKPVSVYDQERRGWFRWNSGQWRPIDPPVIRRRIFTGTGTRRPDELARQALRELYTRTFGPPPAGAAGAP
ncbi:MAG TPA: hypothetical protein PK668_08205 [Myxococcota bacterium]|nr:hypothetical protein [Myxococcota bacterium]HRY93042.1 hypothetical protein [Myxococcota bacterium]HSA21584.1 hypothetical protein [Myxococcota bacterium]